ncbi:MAG: hypothetical protein CR971_00750 [candidate division SR1 bacterium]|nr:MAG: hypothetical protein CR971_00750 [candidate division SR1 bacterium]
MKKWGSKIFLIILLVFLLIFGINFYLEYIGNHQYYSQIFTSRTNRKIVILGLITVGAPILYILLSKKFKISFLTVS